MTSQDGTSVARGGFPPTSLSVIEALRNSDAEVRSRAMDLIVRAYWKPVYKYVRLKRHCSPEDAQDLTQGFFAVALEKNFLAGYDSRKAKFRTFLRTCLDRFVLNEDQARTRLKRGGDREFTSLDFAGAELELARAGQVTAFSPEDYFEREWIRSILSSAIENMQARTAVQGKTLQMKLFENYDIEPHVSSEKITYGRLAEVYGLSQTEVTNYLADMRRQFRAEVLNLLRGLTANEEEFRLEARSILGVDPG